MSERRKVPGFAELHQLWHTCRSWKQGLVGAIVLDEPVAEPASPIADDLLGRQL